MRCGWRWRRASRAASWWSEQAQVQQQGEDEEREDTGGEAPAGASCVMAQRHHTSPPTMAVRMTALAMSRELGVESRLRGWTGILAYDRDGAIEVDEVAIRIAQVDGVIAPRLGAGWFDPLDSARQALQAGVLGVDIGYLELEHEASVRP